jgi:hypothetical protein
MIRFALIAAALAAASGTAAAQMGGGPAATVFAERHALLAADVKCGLLAPGARLALEAGAAQARSALARTGRSVAAMDALAARAADAGRTKACDDPAILAAASAAREGYKLWARLHARQFDGAQSFWLARRTPEPQGGWFLYQPTQGGEGRLGLRSTQAGPQLTAWVNQNAAAARLILRDPRRTAAPEFLAPDAFAETIAFKPQAPSGADTVVFHARSRAMEARGVRFLFDDAALALMARLDSREIVVLELETATGTVRQAIEIGDLAAARAFLMARSD